MLNVEQPEAPASCTARHAVQNSLQVLQSAIRILRRQGADPSILDAMNVEAGRLVEALGV